MSDAGLLSLIIFAPTIGALLLLGISKKEEELMRYFALAVTAITLVLTVFLWGRFNPADPGIQPLAADGARGVAFEWIRQWNIFYRLGYDGISLPLVMLTSFISFLAMMAYVTYPNGIMKSGPGYGRLLYVWRYRCLCSQKSTGSSQRMAVRSRPAASCAFDGNTIRIPGVCAKIATPDWL